MSIRGVSDIGGGELMVGLDQLLDSPAKEDSISTSSKAEKVYTKEEISKELSHLNKWLEAKESHLKFVLHDKLNKYYVQVIDNRTEEVLREIPSKKIMDIVANIYEKLGFIVDEKR
ncbi:flagellar protein FlaG [Brevibacillus borstelensis]|jgi:flagellar protein FlaG|uniref:flagellar protein FlaG n=1 Tax=Brevibacillus borstelensis TaxID=45462 RepID=UPI002E220549|nr:flagellar protein FlaG [Brevibacillus borstelensis]